MALIEFDDVSHAKILVIGVGGGGGNAVNTMISGNLDGVEFIVANTDMQALEANMAPHKIQLGNALTKGLGAGANPEIGRRSAEESMQQHRRAPRGRRHGVRHRRHGRRHRHRRGAGHRADRARLRRAHGRRRDQAVRLRGQEARDARRTRASTSSAQRVDTLITIPNQRLLALVGQKTSLLDAFRKADEVLLNAVQGISDLITVPGLINVDFADVRTIMSEHGPRAHGHRHRHGRASARIEAAEMAISSPLLEDVSIDGATGILINITGGPDLTLHEVNEASSA